MKVIGNILLLTLLVAVCILQFNSTSYTQDIRYGDDLFLAQNFDDDDFEGEGEENNGVTSGVGQDRAGIKYQTEGGDAVAGKPVLVVKNVFFNPLKRQFYASSRDKLYVEAMDDRTKEMYVGVRRIEVGIDSGEYHEYDGPQSGKFSSRKKVHMLSGFEQSDRVGKSRIESLSP